ncbi:MAG: hypothetical protein P8J27_10980 [Mariniblastus sp.]|nr:hypothetical protein [Mariniblastus sp.]
MSYLNRFFQEVFDSKEQSASSFDAVSDDQLAAHLQVSQYDSFELTDAVRPAMDLKIKPCQGYRHDTYVDEGSKTKVPVIMAAASRKRLFPLFMQLIQRLGSSVDVVLESSHAQAEGGHVDLYREHIDMPVLTSILWDFEDLLLNDGCTGIAVLNPNTPQEIQFEEHKLLIVYGSPLEPYEFTLEQNGVTENENIKFITEAEHIHSSSDEYAQRFFELQTALGLDGSQGDARQKYRGDSFEDESPESWKDSYGESDEFGGTC